MAPTGDILIVDDNTDNLRVLAGILKSHGYEARPVTSGTMALKAMAARPPALILMDIMMPEMDGFEACARIKSEARTRDIPLIFLTALDALEDKLKAFSAGAVDYITKPFHEAEVLARIQTHLALIRAQESLRESEALNRQLAKSEGLLRMAAAIAHKFNNHLHAVLGNLEMAKIYASGNPEASKALETGMEAVEKAARLSKLILTYAGKTSVQQLPLDLVSSCTDMLREFEVGLPEGLHLESRLSGERQGILGDPQGIRQILRELFLNAKEATGEKGRIRISVFRCAHEKIPALHRFPPDVTPREGPHVCLEIRDTGQGIAEDDLEKIFDPFFSTHLLGRGMGLASVLGMVRAHGGLIAVQSRPAEGSTFQVFFPLTPTEAGAP